MLCYVQSFSSSTVVGLRLQLLLCEVVFVSSFDTGFFTQEFMSNRSVLNI